MSWLNSTLSSSVGKKILMASSGLFLILFLAGHVSGNLQLFLNDGGESFNKYARFMTTNPAVKLLSYLTYFSFILHIIYSVLLTIRNRKARGNDRYAVKNTSGTFSSRMMAVWGALILVFLVTHLAQFWARMHEFYGGDMPYVTYDGEQYKDLYKLVVTAYANPMWVVLYVVSMIVLAYHLVHGFQSAFRTFGMNSKLYTPFVKGIGYAYAIVVPVLFALMPIYMYFFVN